MLVLFVVNLLAVHLLLQALPAAGLRWNFETDSVGSIPSGWKIRGSSSRPVYIVESAPDGSRYLAASSQSSDVQLGIGITAKPEEMPLLSWRWRVWELPRAADERHSKTLDSAASVYAVFGSRFFPQNH